MKSETLKEPSDKSEDTTNSSSEEKEVNQKPEHKGEGVMVSEKFQQGIHSLISKANKHEVSHARSRISDREDELRMEKHKQDMKENPELFSDENMPTSVGY